MRLTKDYFCSYNVKCDPTEDRELRGRIDSKTVSGVHFLSSITFITDADFGRLYVKLTARNGLLFVYLTAFLDCYKIDFLDVQNTRYLVFNPTRQPINEIKNTIEDIFHRLVLLGLPREIEFFFTQVLKQFHSDLKDHFCTITETFLWNSYYCYDFDKPKESDEFETAIYNGDKQLVWRLLQNGQDTLNMKYNQPMLITSLHQLLVPMVFGDMRYTSIRFSIVILLLCYSADPTQPEQIDRRTAIDWLIDHSISMLKHYDPNKPEQKSGKKEIDNKFRFKIVEQLFQLLSASKKARPEMIPHPNDHTILANLIRKSNEVIITRNLKPHSLFRVEKTVNIHTNSLQFIKATDGNRIFIRSLPIKELLHDQEMFELFKLHYPWQKKIAAQDIKKYFFENFIRTDKETYVDLVYLKGKFVAFNIAEIHHLNINDQNIIFHRVKLALASPEVKPYKRLMSIVSFQRGFALQRKYPATRVVTGFEVAAKASYLQIRDFDNSTLLLHDFIPLIEKFYENEELLFNERSQMFHMPDKLAYNTENKNETDWLTPADLYLKFYDEFLVMPEHDFIVVFDSNEKNFRIASEAIDPLLAETTFNNIVDQLIDVGAKIRARL